MSRVTSFGRALHARRSTRRLLILAAFLGYPLLLVGYANLVPTRRIDALYWAAIATVLASASAIGLAAIYLFVRDRAQLTSNRLDERELALTSRAHVLSYGVLSVVVVVLVAALALVLSFGGPVTLRMEDLSPWIIAIGVFLPALPSAVLAWIEPDVMDDEIGR
jgi:hypothetical protein